ncbi:hypothetical protein Pelo_19119 [Pelomyxa schiedti]|nr:hypothetical protein Pelo_19119 [Pelomyxa schiedti]
MSTSTKVNYTWRKFGFMNADAWLSGADACGAIGSTSGTGILARGSLFVLGGLLVFGSLVVVAVFSVEVWDVRVLSACVVSGNDPCVPIPLELPCLLHHVASIELLIEHDLGT